MIPSNSNIVSIIEACNKADMSDIVNLVKNTATVVTELITLFTRSNNQKLKVAEKGVCIFKNIIFVFSEIFDMSTETTPMSKLSDTKVVEGIQNIHTIIDEVLSITKTLITLSLKFIIMIILYPMFKLGTIILQKAFDNILQVVQKVKDVDKESIENLNSICKAIISISKAIKSIIWISILSVPLLIAAPIAIIGVWIVIQFVKIVAKLVRNVKNITIDAVKNISKISLILLALMVIDAEIILFGLTVPYVIKSILMGMLNVIMILAFLVVVSLLLKFVSRMLEKFIAQIFEFTILMTIIMGALIFAAASLFIISYLGDQVLDKLGSILMVIGVTILVAAAIAGLGYLALYVAPGVLGIMALTVALLCILVMVAVMRIIQEIDLDRDAILESVDIIFDTASQIIGRIFQSREDPPEDDRSGDSKMSAISHGPMSNIWTFVKMLVGCATLFLTLIAVSIILLIAVVLRGLQELDLNETLIIKNVDMVLDTCHHIIGSIFYPRETETEGTKKGFILSVLEWIGGPIATVVEAILALAYVATMMLAIGMIYLMAKMLEGIEGLKLDENKILTNVDKVITTCQHVVESVLYPKEADTKSTKKGFIMSILEWIGGPIVNIIEAILAVAYIATMMLAIGMILLMANMLESLQNLDLDADKILENVSTVITTCQQVQYTIFNPDEATTKNSSKNFIIKILKWIGGPIVDIIEVIMACAYLATAMMAIGLIQVLARQLKDIQDIGLDANAVTTNVDTVINTCQHIVQKVLYPEEDKSKSSNKGFIRKLLKWIGGPIVDIIDVIMACAYLATSMMAVGLVSSLAQQLQTIADIDFDANIIKTNTDKILDCAGYVVRGINRSASEFGTTSSRKGWLARMIRKIAPSLFSIIDSLAATAQVAVASASIAIILKIGKLLSMIGEINIDTDKIKDRVNKIFDCIDHVKALVDEKCAPREELIEGNWYDRWQAARKQARSDRDQMQQLNKANAIILKLASMANSLGAIEKVTINESLLKSRIDFIFATVDRIQEYMNKKSEMKAAEMDKYIRKRKGWFGITWYEYTEEYYRKIKADAQAMGDLDRSSVIMVKLGEMATNLEKIQKIEINESAVIKNINFLFNTMDNISNYFYERQQAITKKAIAAMKEAQANGASFFGTIGAAGDVYRQHTISEGALNTIDATSAVYVALGTMADNLAKINELKINPNKIAQNTLMILDCVDFVTTKLSEREEQQVSIEESICLQHVISINEELDKLKQFDDKAITNTKRTLDNYTKFLDKVNAINPDKVRITTEMFKQMSRFSESIKGNFEKLAESINEDLMPVLDELKKIMEQVPEAVEKSSANISASVAANNNGAQLSKAEMIEQVQREHPEISQTETLKKAMERTQQQAARQADSVGAKLDKLISMLSQGSAKVKTSMW